jgi:hypothetical protein
MAWRLAYTHLFFLHTVFSISITLPCSIHYTSTLYRQTSTEYLSYGARFKDTNYGVQSDLPPPRTKPHRHINTRLPRIWRTELDIDALIAGKLKLRRSVRGYPRCPACTPAERLNRLGTNAAELYTIYQA